MLAKVKAAQVTGLAVEPVEVEVDISSGLQSFNIVGLPDKSVEEARDRITAAIKNSDFPSPKKGNKKIIVSLAPADLRKEGAIFDLAIAVSYLLATGLIKFAAEGRAFLGELALDGNLRPIRGALLIAEHLRRLGLQELYLPRENAAEAALTRGLKIFPVDNLRQLAEHLSPSADAPAGESRVALNTQPPTAIVAKKLPTAVDLAEIRGQETAKRGLLVAAAGGHNVAMQGPPGTGKTLLAKALAGVLPPLEAEAVLEVTGIHSAAGALQEDLITMPPFRAPHHTASYVSLVGGGTNPKPGEITLAHRGVLFLDEFPEFEKRVIEALRQPLEDRVIHIARARGAARFPASFILVATMNPCPCGHYGERGRECVCSPSALARYRRRLSGPIIDRLDLWLHVPQIDPGELSGLPTGESSAAFQKKIAQARAIQRKRFRTAELPFNTNSEMGLKELRRFAALDEQSTQLLNQSARQLDLSARAYHRVIKLARTIADLEAAENIATPHLLEALQYRPRTGQ